MLISETFLYKIKTISKLKSTRTVMSTSVTDKKYFTEDLPEVVIKKSSSALIAPNLRTLMRNKHSKVQTTLKVVCTFDKSSDISMKESHTFTDHFIKKSFSYAAFSAYCNFFCVTCFLKNVISFLNWYAVNIVKI